MNSQLPPWLVKAVVRPSSRLPESFAFRRFDHKWPINIFLLAFDGQYKQVVGQLVTDNV